jgi:hypothetical protein
MRFGHLRLRTSGRLRPAHARQVVSQREALWAAWTQWGKYVETGGLALARSRKRIRASTNTAVVEEFDSLDAVDDEMR